MKLEEEENCTFHPEINEASKMIVNDLIIGGERESMIPSDYNGSVIPNKGLGRHDCSHNQTGFSFHPQINDRSEKLA
jgi:hypothetical protein